MTDLLTSGNEDPSQSPVVLKESIITPAHKDLEKRRFQETRLSSLGSMTAQLLTITAHRTISTNSALTGTHLIPWVERSNYG